MSRDFNSMVSSQQHKEANEAQRRHDALDNREIPTCPGCGRPQPEGKLCFDCDADLHYGERK